MRQSEFSVVLGRKGSKRRYTSILASQIDQILTETRARLNPNARARVQRRLIEAESWCRISQNRAARRLLVSDLVKRLRQIARTAKALCEFIREDDPKFGIAVGVVLEPLNPETREQGFPIHSALERLDKDLPVVAVAAERARESLFRTAAKGRGGLRRHSDWTFKIAIFQLIEIFEEATGRRAGISTSPVSSLRGGPLLRFLKACLSRLGIMRSDETLRRFIRTYRSNQKSGRH